jgi:Pectate lyase superfamily protein
MTPITRRTAFTSAGLAMLGASLAASSHAAESAATRTDSLNVRSFGAKGDDKTDDTAAFQAAIDAAAASGGGSVFVPAGMYRIDGTLILKRNVTLEGIFTAPPTIPWTAESLAKNAPDGSVLLAFSGKGDAGGTPFIQLDYNATLKGIAVYYPEQTDTNPPIAYPWTISSLLTGADNCSIVDVLLVNPYQAVDFGGRHTGRHFIRNLNAAPLHRGLFIDHCIDVGRVENVHFWPFWGATGGAAEYRRKHGKAFIIGRSDWQQLTNCFCIDYETGFQFIACTGLNAVYAGGGNAQINGGGADTCNRAVHVVELQGHSGTRFTNSQIYGDIIVEPTNDGPLQFSACGLFGSVHAANGIGLARIEGGGKVSFTDCHILCLDPRNTLRPLIHAKAGRVQVRGCDFIDGALPREHVLLEDAVLSANISDNTSRTAFTVINKAKGKTVIRDNLSEA